MTKPYSKPDIIEQHWSHVIKHLFRSLPNSSENRLFAKPQKPPTCGAEESAKSEPFRPSYSLYCEESSSNELTSANKENVDKGLSRLMRELIIEVPLKESAGTEHYISEAGAIKVPGGERRVRRTPPPLNEENDDLAPLLVAQDGDSSDDEGGVGDSEPDVEDEEVEDEQSESDEEGLDFDEALELHLAPLGERKKNAKAANSKSETGESSASVKKRQSTSHGADSESSSDEEDDQVQEEHPRSVNRKRRNTDDDDDSQGGRAAKGQLLAV